MKFDPKAILEKQGWAEGTGLGKHSQGITEPIKAKMKFDKKGLGNSGGANFNFQWWDHAYNAAAKKLKVVASEDGGVEVQCDGEETVLSTKKGKLITPYTTGNYKNFIKNATLSDGVTVEHPQSSDDSDSDADSDLGTASKFTDEELFAKCKGLTAHKGARHGIYLSGKLQRVKEQEELAMKSLNRSAAQLIAARESAELEIRDESVEKKRKKRKHGDDLEKFETKESATECDVVCGESELGPRKKKRKTGDAEKVEISDNEINTTPKDEDVVPKKKKNKRSKREELGNEDVPADVNAVSADVNFNNNVKSKKRKTKNISEEESKNKEESNNHVEQEIEKPYEEPVIEICSNKKRKNKKEEMDSLVSANLLVDDNDEVEAKQAKKKSKKMKIIVETEKETNICDTLESENKALLGEDSSTKRKTRKEEENKEKIKNKELCDGSVDCLTRYDETKIESDVEASLEHRKKKKAKKSRACESEEKTIRPVSEETLDGDDESSTVKVRSKKNKKSFETSNSKSDASEPIEENDDEVGSSRQKKTRKKNGGVAKEEDVQTSVDNEIAKVGKRKKIKKEES